MMELTNPTARKSSNRNIFAMIWGLVAGAHHSIVEPGARRQAQLLAGLTLFTILTDIVAILSILATHPNPAPVYVLVVQLVIAIVVYILSRTTRYYAGALLQVFAISTATYFYTAVADTTNLASSILTQIPLVFIFATGILSVRATIILAVYNIAGMLALNPFLKNIPLSDYGAIFGQVFTLGLLFSVVVASRSAQERGRLQQVQQANQELQALSAGLEVSVHERIQDISLAAEVGRRLTLVGGDVEAMLTGAVELVRERFNLYYTQVYLLDDTGRRLVLRAGTGVVGEELLRRSHSLPFDLTSLNGTTAVERRPVIVEDTTASRTFRPNPLLPDTRSELTVPLVAGDRVLGVLDLQSAKPGTFTAETLPAFETLAGLLASAIVNAELVSQVQRAREEVEAQTRFLTRRGWEEYLNAIDRKERVAYHYGSEKVGDMEAPNVAQTDNEKVIETPIVILGEEIGQMKFEGQRDWTADEIELVQTISRQVAQSMENLRLLAQAEHYRSEAEAALRRLTREGWEEYLAQEKASEVGYVYMDEQVKPIRQASAVSEPGIVHPIRIRDEVVGEMSISGVENLNPEDTELLNLVSTSLASHLETIRLFDTAQTELEERSRAEQALQKRASELQTVAQLSANLSTVADPNEIMQNVVDLTRDSFGLYHAHIYSYDADRQALKLAAGAGEVGKQMVSQGWEIPLRRERSLVAQAARSQSGVIVNDVRVEPDYLPNPLLPNTQSEMAIPLLVGQNLLGVMDVQSDEINHFTSEDLSIYTTLASQISAALENARLFKQIQKQAEYEATINAISQRIQSTTTVESALQVAIRELGRALGARRTSVHLTPLAEQTDAVDDRSQ